jgi:4-hydroxy-3-methylbut-2-enyl diphosphate reductase
MQEGRIDRSQPVEVALRHHGLAYLDAPYNDSVYNSVEKLLLAAPRGYCAGVDRAVQTVERALEIHGAPVYVRKEIVHNKHVVEALRERGAIFVDEHTEVPEGAVCVFSAHGVAPSVRAGAVERSLQTIDATCPLVTKVHREAVRFAQEGYTIVLVGHDGHEEVEGTMGEAPEQIVLVQSEEDVETLEVADPERIAYVTQTTLAVGETTAILERLRERFPSRRQADGRQLRPAARDRLAQLLQLGAPGGGGARLRHRRPPDRQRRRGR